MFLGTMPFGRACAVVAVLALAPGCMATPQPRDVGFDAADAYLRPDVLPDDTTNCDMACPGIQVCCLGPSGPRCVDLTNDITNCGLCNRDCVASRRGDSCASDQCGCGDFPIGCTGAENSVCCPGIGSGRAYCSNPGLDFSDCGGCGHACNNAQANQCQAGMCLCGDTGGACSGAAASRCCSDPAGFFACADTTSDQAHCGACGRRCRAFEHCVASACVPTISDAGVPDGG